MRLFPTYLISTALAAVCCVGLGAQQRTHMPGLENNAEYRALVAEEERLSLMSDSISVVMNDIRRSFRTDTLNRAANSAAILRMEEEIFDIRNRTARVVGQINTIEQSWIRENLDSDDPDDPTLAEISQGEDARQVANLVYNKYFADNLSAKDLGDLYRAQELEASVPGLIETYRENNGRLRVLKTAYDLSTRAGAADTVRMRFDSLTRVNAAVDRYIEQTWAAVFDNKSYAYNLLMDKYNRNDRLLLYESDMENLRRQMAEWQGVYASDEIVKYALQKNLLCGYEIMLAEDLSNHAAADSLRKVQAALPRVDRLDLEPVRLRERLFLDYEDIEAGSSSPYNSRNPIPEVTVYPKGVIYRVLLGTYSAPQQPSVFRNVSPLAVQKGPDGKYRYFAGGFRSDSTANAAVERMRRVGFRKPEAVVWMDGVYVNMASGTGFGSGFFRIELSGIQELAPETRETIDALTGGRDIVRGEDMFIIAPLDDAAEAVGLRLALEGLDEDMEIKISEIPE